jgi:hypothetical protein
MRSPSRNENWLDRARDDFALLFYRWACVNAVDQATHGFPLLSLVRSNAAAKYLRLYQELPITQRSAFLRAMAKRTHTRAVELTSEFLTNEEQQLVAKFLNPPWATNTDERETSWNHPRLTQHDRKLLAKMLKDRIARETGGEFEEWAPGVIVFSRVVGRWRVSTTIAVKSQQNLGYEHGIALEGDPEARLKEYTSVTRWLGIGEANWNLMTPNELEESSRSVLVLARYFLDAVPDILSKIEIN